MHETTRPAHLKLFSNIAWQIHLQTPGQTNVLDHAVNGPLGNTGRRPRTATPTASAPNP